MQGSLLLVLVEPCIQNFLTGSTAHLNEDKGIEK